jgi:hypothetical protein
MFSHAATHIILVYLVPKDDTLLLGIDTYKKLSACCFKL